MDKVTQSNAANAEESASASEELSAQSAELHELVATLSRIVGGNGVNGNGHVRGRSGLISGKTFRSLHSEKDTVSHEHGRIESKPEFKMLVTKDKTTVLKEGKRVSPDEIIPLSEF
jgi:methyl-accepting chemotaxis protein